MRAKQVYFYIFPAAFLYFINSCMMLYIIEQVRLYYGDKHAERHRVLLLQWIN